jgi:hypothetical protein
VIAQKWLRAEFGVRETARDLRRSREPSHVSFAQLARTENAPLAADYMR